MNKYSLLIVALFFFTLPTLGVIIEGHNPEYAGKKLKFFRFSDPVTQEKISSFNIEFDTEGNFKTSVDFKKTSFVFCDFGIYRGMSFIEPGKNLHLRFPPLREKSFSEQKNPFFKPVEFWFATKDGNGLNDRVSAFEAKLNQLTDKYFNQLYFQQSEQIFDTISATLNNRFDSSACAVFTGHKKLKINVVRADAFRLGPSELSEVLSEVAPEYRTHPAFIELFEKAFDNKLSFEVKKVNNSQLVQAVANADNDLLIGFLKENFNVTNQFAELALLKMLHDGYYSGDFPENTILKMVNSAKLQNNRNRQIAKNVKRKLEFLQTDDKAPVICLKNTHGNEVCTNQNSGKFKYLVFADTEMVVCQEQLKYLSKIEEQFAEHLEIFVILRKTEIIEMKLFLNKQEIPGHHLVDENAVITDKYRVKSFPSCILLNQYHEVVFRQAKAPLDGFEQQFGKFLQKELFERQRNQAR